MAMTAAHRVWPGVLVDAPPLPEGYHFEAMRNTPNGVRIDVHFMGARIFEIAAEMDINAERFEERTRYAARAIYEFDPYKRMFNQPTPWTEFPDLPSLITSMITRHRIGV